MQTSQYAGFVDDKSEWGKDVFVEIDVNTSLDRNSLDLSL